MDPETRPALAIATSVVVMAIGGRITAQHQELWIAFPQPLPREETRDRIQEKQEADRRNCLCRYRRPRSCVPRFSRSTSTRRFVWREFEKPRLNVVRQRVLEAVAIRQLAAAQFLPLDQPRHEL